MFTLYSTALSGNGLKVLAVSRHLGLTPRMHLVDVYRGEGRTPEYLAVNPTGKIPALVDEDFTLSESNAILEYICEAYGDFRLFSRDPRERAAISSWLFWESAHWQPALVPVLASLVGHKLRPESIPAPIDAPNWDDEQLRPLLARLDGHLRDQPFLGGNSVTIADFSVGGMTTYFRAASFPFAEFANLTAWHSRLRDLEAWEETEADIWK